mgnify:CR=1 FL=1
MSWFDVIKEDDNQEELLGTLQESALKIIQLIDEGRDKLFQQSEPMVQDMMNLGIDEKIARDMVNGILAPMLKELDEREAKIKRELEELGDENKL